MSISKKLIAELDIPPAQLSFDFENASNRTTNVLSLNEYRSRSEITLEKETKRKSVQILLDHSKKLDW